MKKWALVGTIIAFSAALSMLIAPTTISALPQHPVDTSKTIDEFGEDVKIYLDSKTPGDGKKKPPGQKAPGQKGNPPPNKTPGEGEPPKKPGKPKEPGN